LPAASGQSNRPSAGKWKLATGNWQPVTDNCFYGDNGHAYLELDVHSRTADFGERRRTAASGVTTFEPSHERASAYGLATAERGLGSAVTGWLSGIRFHADADTRSHSFAAGCHAVADPGISGSGNDQRSGAYTFRSAAAHDNGPGCGPLH
jgi:hypothetical protein